MDGPEPAPSPAPSASPTVPDVYLEDSPSLIPYSSSAPVKYKGVTVDPRTPGSRWRARVSQRGHEKLLGPFNSALFAARVYDAAALYLRGPVSSLMRFLNFPSTAAAVVAATDAPAMRIAATALRSDKRFFVEAEGPEEGVETGPAPAPATPAPAPAPAPSSRPARPSSKMIVYDFDEEVEADDDDDSYVEKRSAPPPAPASTRTSVGTKRVDPLSSDGSGYRGVNYRPHRHQYEASISLHGARMFCGSYSAAYDAARARETRGFIAFGDTFREKCNWPDEADALCAILRDRGLLGAGQDAAAGHPTIDVSSGSAGQEASYSSSGGRGGGGSDDMGVSASSAAMNNITDDVNVWADVPDGGGLTPAEDTSMKYRGVVFRAREGMYEVFMKHQGVKQFHGKYASADEAARVYDELLLSQRPSIALRNANFPDEMRRKLNERSAAAAAAEGSSSHAGVKRSRASADSYSGDNGGSSRGEEPRKRNARAPMVAWSAATELRDQPAGGSYAPAPASLSRARDEVAAAIVSVGTATMEVEDALRACSDAGMRATLQSLRAAIHHACTRVTATYAALASMQAPVQTAPSLPAAETIAPAPAAAVSPRRQLVTVQAYSDSEPPSVAPEASNAAPAAAVMNNNTAIASVSDAVDQCAAIADALMN